MNYLYLRNVSPDLSVTINSFVANHPFSTPLKHQKTVSFSDVFRGERKGPLGTNPLMLQFEKRLMQNTSRNFTWGYEAGVLIDQ